MSSTRHDRNYRSWDGGGDDPPHTQVVLDPLHDPELDENGERCWKPGSWQDTAKFYRRMNERFAHIQILEGGTEDGVDFSSENHGCTLEFFVVKCGQERALTLKGGSCENVLSHWLILGRGKIVEEEFGVWSSSSQRPDTGNVCIEHRCEDGESLRYAYVLGRSKPTYQMSQVKHIWWWSICITIHWWAKYLWHVKLGRPDN